MTRGFTGSSPRSLMTWCWLPASSGTSHSPFCTSVMSTWFLTLCVWVGMLSPLPSYGQVWRAQPPNVAHRQDRTRPPDSVFGNLDSDLPPGFCLGWQMPSLAEPFAGVGTVNPTEKARGKLGSCRYWSGTESWQLSPGKGHGFHRMGKLKSKSRLHGTRQGGH